MDITEMRRIRNMRRSEKIALLSKLADEILKDILKANNRSGYSNKLRKDLILFILKI